MATKSIKLVFAAVAAITVAGCADGSTGLLSTASVGATSATMTSAKADPACVSLNSRINTLRLEGVAERVGKAAEGNTKSVTVKRESLAKMAELDKANAEFQAKCALPLPASAAVAPAAAPAMPAATTAKPAAAAKVATTAAAKTAVPAAKTQ